MPNIELNPLPDDVGAPTEAAVHPVTALVQKLIAGNAKFDQLVQVYMQLRDKKTELDAKAKAAVAPLKEGLDAIEAHMLARFEDMGVDNVKTPFGTPYISTKTSVTMADADIFWRFLLAKSLAEVPLPEAQRNALIDRMVASGALAFMEARPAKSVCEQFATDTSSYPPGVNTRVERVVNVKAK